MLHVRLLGELQADVDGRPVAPPASRRAWSLLGWLALHPGEHPRGAVAARFWPDVLDSSARASLRSAAWALRRALGADDALVAGRDRIGLRCATDLAEFDAHCAAGRLEEAVALLPRPAARRPRRGLGARGARRARRAARRGARAARGGRADPAAAVGYARRRLALDPLDEEAARDLMRRQVAGRRPRRARSRPTTASPTACARTSASRRRPRPARWPRACAPREPSAADRRSDATRRPRPLVGRAAEQAALLAVVGSAPATGAGGAIALLSGEGGIGKTRLATDLLARADTARTARATAVDLGGGAPPFGPWAELLAGPRAPARPAAGRRRMAGGARAARALAAAPARPRRRAQAQRRAARPRARAPVRGRGRARRARDAGPPARAAARRRPPRRRADARARRLPRAPHPRPAGAARAHAPHGPPPRRGRRARARRAARPASRPTEIELEPLAARRRRAPRRLAREPRARARDRRRRRQPAARARERPRRGARRHGPAGVAARRRPRRDRHASTTGARRTAELAAVAGRDLDRTELAALADPETVLRGDATAACSAAPTAASASATRCCATRSTPTSTTPAAAPTTRRSGTR